MRVEVEEYWEDCPYLTCTGKRVRLAYDDVYVDVLVHGDEIVRVFDIRTPREMSLEEALELASSIIEAAKSTKVRSMLEPQEYTEPHKGWKELLDVIREIQRDIGILERKPHLQPSLLPASRHICWEEDYFGEKRRYCMATPYIEVVVPKRWGRVKHCHPTYGYLREEECEYRPGVVEWQVLPTKPGPPPERTPTPEIEPRPTERAVKKAIEELKRLYRNLLLTLAPA